MKDINKFLNALDKNNIFYQLSKTRPDSIMVTVIVPGQRWEVEFMDDGTVVIEKFISDGTIYGEDELEILF